MEIRHVGELAAVGVALCWTVTSMAFQSAGRRVGSIPVNLIRLAMAIPLLALWSGLTRGAPFPCDASAHAWLWLSLSGFVGFTLGDMFLFRAFVVIGARTSMLLMSLVPLFTALFGGMLMGEELSALDWTGMALTILGVGWVVLERAPSEGGSGQGGRALGVAFGVAGALGQAVGLVLSKYGLRDYDPFLGTQIRAYAGLVGLSVLYLFLGAWPRVVVALRDGPGMRRISLGTFFGPFLGVSLSLFAVQNRESGAASTLMALVPVFILAPAALVFKERISLRAVLGAVVAVSGAALLFL